MKTIISLLVYLSFATVVYAQNLPSVDIKTLEGKNINTSTIKSNDKPFIICFWKSCCKVNETMLEILSEHYDDWQEEFEVKIYAVSIDDSRSAQKIKPLVNAKGWSLEFLQDINSDFKRALGVNTVPHISIYNSYGNLITQLTGFSTGTENEIYEILKENKK
ncbi:MAG: redoxin domain-containing protein [Bacteroidales bacterium]|nr:redoxin domain-containing protein [Bacteroidales bacterium]MDD2203816.1 redoxin domain-containing protein [Bacteroidales bacterium]MDD3913245.1 redoxin domain-containing protein [Bacteroidales bacterium]MDD4633276.1 redoxin domain-containing protein [Bacteroidales bacterium]